MKKTLSFVLILFTLFACVDNAPTADKCNDTVGSSLQAFDETKAYVRIQNNTEFAFRDTEAYSSEGSIDYGSVSSSCYSGYEETSVEIAAVTAIGNSDGQSLSSPPAGFFGTTLSPGLYTCTVSFVVTSEGNEELVLNHEQDRSF
ncbi:MAG: hypothetical protein WBB45_18620 [Cyclobacteriaceae bacterium]